MMIKYVNIVSRLAFCLGCVLLLSGVYAQTTAIPQKIGEKFALNVVKQLKKSQLPEGSNLAVTFFYYKNGLSDTLVTYLGLALSENFAHELSRGMSEKKMTHSVLFPGRSDKNLDKLMLSYFTPPSTLEEENRFYNELFNRQRPDYFITARYRISPGFSAIIIENAMLIPNKFSEKPATQNLAFENSEILVSSSTDRSAMASLNYEIKINPVWTSYAGRINNYPPDRYYQGYASENVNDAGGLNGIYDRLMELAANQMNQQIKIKLNNTNPDESNNSNIPAFCGFDKTIVNSEVFYDEINKKAHVFCYTATSEAVSFYSKMIASLTEQTQQKIDAASDYLKSGNKPLAISTYTECYPLLERMDNAALILSVLDASQAYKGGVMRDQVSRELQKLQSSGFMTLDELAAYIASSMKIQTGAFNGKISISNLTYSDMGFASSFSARLSESLTTKLVTVAAYNLTLAYDPSELTNTFKGNYWEENDQLKVSCVLLDPFGNILAATEAGILQSYLTQSGIEWKPSNIDKAAGDQQQAMQGEVADGDLAVSLWTNKGSANPVFKDGERLTIFIRVNKPCYIRLVDYTSSGQNFLLYDNYQITADMVNVAYKLPSVFECGEPFGAEVLQLFAQTEPFGVLQTRMVNGFKLILDDVGTINKSGRRAFKEVKEYAEVKLKLTTVAK